MEVFVKGLNDHCKFTRPQVKNFKLSGDYVEISLKQCMYWLNRANDSIELEKVCFESRVLRNAIDQNVKIPSLQIHHDSSTSWEWLSALESFAELRSLEIFSSEQCSLPPIDMLCWLIQHRLENIMLNFIIPSNSIYNLHTPTDIMVDSVLKSCLRSNQITELALPNISRETMAGVHSIILHCPNLATLRMKNTRLGHDGILFICSALRNNTTLRHLKISEDLQLPETKANTIEIASISYMETVTVPLPGKTTCTDFLLELNNILKDNATLQDIEIKSTFFLPLTLSAAGHVSQWTGLGPLQQFNVGAVGSGMSPNLRRSFSSSDLTQPQTTIFWKQNFGYGGQNHIEIDFKKLFSTKKELGGNVFFLPSFIAPDTEVLQSFSSLDPRLRECLEISHLNVYVKTLRKTCQGMLTRLQDWLTKDLIDEVSDSSTDTEDNVPNELNCVPFLLSPSITTDV